MPQPIEISPGMYRHYKGGKYLVLFVADDSTNKREGNKVVVYASLAHGTINCRDLNEFTEIVAWPDGGQKPRFIGAFTSLRKHSKKEM